MKYHKNLTISRPFTNEKDPIILSAKKRHIESDLALARRRGVLKNRTIGVVFSIGRVLLLH